MRTREEFIRLVKDALAHLYDYPHLQDHPLALQYWPRDEHEGPSRAQRLHRLLLESIEELYPPDTPLSDAPHARYYSLLVYRYVERWPLPEILRELACSRRQFFREQQKALMALADVLWEKLPRQTSPPAEAEDPIVAEAERIFSQREAVDPIEVVRGVLKAIGHLAEQRGVALECALSPRLPSIYGNRTLLRQVLLNALSRLITLPGIQKISLHMRYERRRVLIELVAGADVSSLSGDVSDPHVPALDFSQRLVEMMGGQWQGLQVSPAGYTCRFSFPTDGQKVLLVVEDNESVIRAFRRFLAGYEYQVVGATTGAEALRLARELEPTAITLDVMMPAQDGWEILQALKNDPATQHIPVIICSVLDDPDLARSLGAVAYLHKPVTQADLLSVLANLSGAS
ncbi:MAG: response regulator [Chloroflexi bacterium]|nr:response regulator [Chloroflexota bacterium]